MNKKTCFACHLVCLSLICSVARAQSSGEKFAPSGMTLNDASKILLLNNPDVLAAKALVNEFEARHKAAYSNFYPSLAVNLGRTETEAGAARQKQYNYNLSGSYSLFSGMADAAALKKSRFELQKARSDYKTAETEAFFSLRRIFAQIASAKEQLVLNHEVIRRRQENVQLVKLKYNAGRESNAALLETEALLETSKWKKQKTERELKTAQKKLNQLLGRDIRLPILIMPAPVSPEPPLDFSDFEPELKTHPSVVSNEAGLNASREELSRIRGGFMPGASLSGAWGRADSEWPPDAKNWNWSFQINWPLFSGWKTKNDTKSARAEINRVEEILKKTRDDVFISAEDSFLQWKETYSLMKVREVTLNALSERAWLVKNQYVSGQTAYFEWRQAEENLTSAQEQLLAAKYELEIAYAEFEKAMGRGINP